MRLGIIDLGTNSVRFDIHSIDSRGKTQLLHREKLMVRLGQGVFLSGRLEPTAIRRTLHAFLAFKKTAEILHTQKIIAYATCALREATDAEDLVDQVRIKTGIEIRVISGREEAELIALGILDHNSLPKGKFGLIDIGGGSTEISLCQGRKVLHAESFALGGARLQQLFLKTHPPQFGTRPCQGNVKRTKALVSEAQFTDPIALLRHSIRSALLPRTAGDRWPKVSKLIGSSGTIRSLEKILKKTAHTNGIERKPLGRLVKEMSTLTLPELLQIPGMEPKRVDIILAGAILLEECMEALGAVQVITSNYSLRDGILDREIRLLFHQGNIHQEPRIQFELKELEEKAKSLGSQPLHFQHISSLTETLFHETGKLHRLSSDWIRYLKAAAILLEVGKAITPTHYPIHTYYIIKNASFLSMEKWESEFIGQLCLRHDSNRLSKVDLNFTKDKNKRRAYLYLLGILRVASALGQQDRPKLKIQKVAIQSTKILLSVSARAGADLEILNVDQKKELFEKVFKRTLTVQEI